ncbi:cytokinin riboside 5'-monophosphate phosphoribohydrolase [Novimethylophilus kurashikiensis]|uniref:Cytokinin riboside 5'-monophosphate phosphoribohydrolase n=1 Tax=Novimethylophilus kurashikiensis TaxID=1825523 RepID=A0A2R5FCE1_9PROT|nr:hypothetical protein [Novimethylophilus kurashikiensis]GBG14603.1 cytokinin riboside 5'-monophosphate phosphoribohydrolase [Novimethylophilus kurashikiensis]
MTHEAQITVERAAIHLIDGESWLLLRDKLGNIYQRRNCFKVSEAGFKALSESSEVMGLVQAGDQVKIRWHEHKHGPLELETARTILSIEFL